MGFANPVLYGLASTQQQFAPFHDVTSGTNLFYPATANYDMASGLGSPDVYNIARDIAGGSVPPPSPTASPTGTPSPTPTRTNTPAPSPTATDTPVPPPTVVPTDTPVPQPPPSGSLIQNGDFEQGVDPWLETSASGYELIDTSNPHSRQYSAYLCGYGNCDDGIAQSFAVPSHVSHISVSYWWFGYTTRTAHRCRDVFTVTLLDSNGKVIAKVQHSCNTDAKSNWQQVSLDVTSKLSNYAGQTVTLVFNGKTASGIMATSSFFVDDVAVGGV